MTRESTCTETLAEFAVNLKYEDIPKDIVHKAKILMLDYIGDVLRGFRLEDSQNILSGILELDKSSEATIWRLGRKISCPGAAMANIAAGESAELNGGPVMSFPGCVTSIIAVAEKEKISDGRRIIASFVTGYEVGWRPFAATNPQTVHFKRGFYHSGIYNPFCHVAAVCKLLELNKEQTTWAYGLAGASGTGTFQGFREGIRDKIFYCARAGETGILAAYMAKNGVKGASKIIESDVGGYLKCYSDPDYDIKMATHKLGKEWWTKYGRIKLVSGCIHTHSSVDAVLKLMQKDENMGFNNVEKIVAKVSEEENAICGSWRPVPVKSQFEIQFSIPYMVSLALKYRRRPRPEDYSLDVLRDEKVAEVARKVEVIPDRELTETKGKTGYSALPPFYCPCIMTVRTKDGKEHTIEVERPRGTYPDDASDEEIFDKFRNVRFILSEAKVEKIISTVMELERLQDVDGLTKLFY
jgi:2-methylcitrate dehydratase PrpD